MEEYSLRLSNNIKSVERALLGGFITESLKEDRSVLSTIILQQLEEIWEKRYNKIFQAIKFIDKGKGVVDPVSYMKIIVYIFLGISGFKKRS